MARVLLVEDDVSLGRTLAERLERERLTVEWAQTVAEARARLDAGEWDLAIVDVKLPDGSGFGLARQIKKSMTTPVMFMTALNSAENRLEGFEIGADEYLPKPFHLKEFIIRVRHVLARQRPRHTRPVRGRLIDFEAMTVDGPAGQRTFLQVRDSRVLKLLVDAAPRVVDRSEILDRAWGQDRFPTPRAVDNAIVRLRQALGDADGDLIRSVRGVGYQWAGEPDA
jgi:two-component system phosphate regulon response regulator PhoB